MKKFLVTLSLLAMSSLVFAGCMAEEEADVATDDTVVAPEEVMEEAAAEVTNEGCSSRACLNFGSDPCTSCRCAECDGSDGVEKSGLCTTEILPPFVTQTNHPN